MLSLSVVLCYFVLLMILRPPRSTRTDTLFPYTTLFRSLISNVCIVLSASIFLCEFSKLILLSARPRRLRVSVSSSPDPFFADLDPTDTVRGDRKSTRLNSITNAHLVCRLLLEKKNMYHRQMITMHTTGLEE